MTTTRPRRLAALATALVLGWAALGLAQGPGKPKDSDLDDLLKKVEDAAKPKADPARPGAVAPKDKDLDDFLDKIGEEKDKPSADGKPPEPPPGGAGDDKKPNGGDKGDKKDQAKGDGPRPKKDDGLTGQDRDLDRHLAGEKDKARQNQRRQQGQGQGKDEEDGPLGDLIKQMREVEQRLGKPDTGEQTRQKQTEIVKRMDGLIAQMRLVRTPAQMRRMMQQGRQPGRQPGEQPGALAEGAPPMRPATPRPKAVVAVDKNTWGHLPQALRDEMENVAKEAGLPDKLDLIKRYYMSVAKKSLAREE